MAMSGMVNGMPVTTTTTHGSSSSNTRGNSLIATFKTLFNTVPSFRPFFMDYLSLHAIPYRAKPFLYGYFIQLESIADHQLQQLVHAFHAHTKYTSDRKRKRTLVETNDDDKSQQNSQPLYFLRTVVPETAADSSLADTKKKKKITYNRTQTGINKRLKECMTWLSRHRRLATTKGIYDTLQSEEEIGLDDDGASHCDDIVGDGDGDGDEHTEPLLDEDDVIDGIDEIDDIDVDCVDWKEMTMDEEMGLDEDDEMDKTDDLDGLDDLVDDVSRTCGPDETESVVETDFDDRDDDDDEKDDNDDVVVDEPPTEKIDVPVQDTGLSRRVDWSVKNQFLALQKILETQYGIDFGPLAQNIVFT